MNTKKGGSRLRESMIAKYGSHTAWKQEMRKRGSRGGSKGKADGVIKGFARNPELAREAGRKGGRISRRGKAIR